VLVLVVLGCGGGTPKPAVVAIEVTPPDVDIAAGARTQLAATAQLDDGGRSDVTTRASWSSSRPDIASVTAGALQAHREGAAVLTVQLDAVSTTVAVAVGPAVPASLRTDPAQLALAKGLSADVAVVATILTDGSERPVTGPVTWSSSDVAVAEATSSGHVVARAEGTAELRASAEGVSGTASVHVGPAQLTGMRLVPAERTGVLRGTYATFSSVGTFTDGTERDVTAEVTWSTVDAAIATITAAGRVRGLEGGSTRVRAERAGIMAEGDLGIVPVRLVFTTSAWGSSDFTSRLDTAYTAGAAGADIACSRAAAAAGLPGTYRAWISDSRDDAWCRVHGLGGKKLENCGQSALPGDAGPWVRTDGVPFASSLSQAIAGAMHPPMYDEYGKRVRSGQYVWTGTGLDGAADRSPYSPPTDYCEDWSRGNRADELPGSDGRSYAMAGTADSAGQEWNFRAWTGCGAPLALLCMEVAPGHGPALPPRQAVVGKRIFVTSTTGPGNLASWPGADGLTGRAAADAICMRHATLGNLTGTYKAYLSTSAGAAPSRVSGDGPWVRLDGELVAANRAELTSGALRAPVLLTESRAIPQSGVYVWTGTSPFGASTSSTCQDWTAGDATPMVGEVGSAHSAGMEWMAQAWTASCWQQPSALYCIED
jgi:hypothetical protein